jgi:hypothetical protein
MRDWSGEIDVTEAFTSNFRLNDLNSTFLAHNTAVFHALVFSADAFEVLNGPKNLRTEKTIAFWFERTIVDRLRFFDLAMAPLPNFFGARNAYAHGRKTQWVFLLLKNAEDVLAQSNLHGRPSAPVA